MFENVVRMLTNVNYITDMMKIHKCIYIYDDYVYKIYLICYIHIIINKICVMNNFK